MKKVRNEGKESGKWYVWIKENRVEMSEKIVDDLIDVVW